MKHFNLKLLATATVIISLAGLVSCKKNDDEPDVPKVEKQNFLFVHVVSQEQAYVGMFGDLDSEVADNKTAFEYNFGVYPFPYKDMVLLPEGTKGDKIHKFIRDANGYLKKDKTLVLEQGSRPGEINFIDENLAYASLVGRGKIAIFNPSKMEKIGEIDLSKYAINDNNPDPGCSVIREGKMYVALNQLSSTHGSYPGVGAEVAVVNLLSEKVEKVMKDNRTGAVGLFRHSDAFVDERGDIYFYSAGKNFNIADKEGFLRIRQNREEWDPDYQFSLSQTPIAGLAQKGQYIIKFLYAGNGIVYACLKVSDSEFGILKKDFQPVKIDVWNKTIEKLDLPLTDSMGSFAITSYKGLIIFGMTTEKSSGYYTYNPATGECSQTPRVVAVGMPSSIIAFE